MNAVGAGFLLVGLMVLVRVYLVKKSPTAGSIAQAILIAILAFSIAPEEPETLALAITYACFYFAAGGVIAWTAKHKSLKGNKMNWTLWGLAACVVYLGVGLIITTATA